MNNETKTTNPKTLIVILVLAVLTLIFTPYFVFMSIGVLFGYTIPYTFTSAVSYWILHYVIKGMLKSPNSP